MRRSQERLIATPLLERLTNALGDSDAVEHQFLRLLNSWRDQPPEAQGNGPGNVVNMLRLLRGELRGRDLSRLLLRQVAFQGVNGQDTSLADATLQESSFTGSPYAVEGFGEATPPQDLSFPHAAGRSPAA